jgi:hypothetical protein
MGILVHCILLVAATLLCWNKKGGTAAVVLIGPENIHVFVDGTLEKWAMSGKFGLLQKWWVGTTAEGLLCCNRR